MRLDLFLKHTRLIKRRTLAKNFCLKGFVLVNDRVQKPSFDVKDGDTVTLVLGNKMVTVTARITQKDNVIYLSYDQNEEVIS